MHADETCVSSAVTERTTSALSRTDRWVDKGKDLLRGQTWPAQTHTVAPLPALLALSVPHSILLVHHLLQEGLVVSVERSHTDVSDSSEFTTVVQMFVLQAEEVPHKAPTRIKHLPITESYSFCYFIIS